MIKRSFWLTKTANKRARKVCKGTTTTAKTKVLSNAWRKLGLLNNLKKFRRAINWVGKLGLGINLWSVKDITKAIIKGVNRKRSKKNKGRAQKDQAANISLFCNELPFFLLTN